MRDNFSSVPSLQQVCRPPTRVEWATSNGEELGHATTFVKKDALQVVDQSMVPTRVFLARSTYIFNSHFVCCNHYPFCKLRRGIKKADYPLQPD